MKRHCLGMGFLLEEAGAQTNLGQVQTEFVVRVGLYTPSPHSQKP